MSLINFKPSGFKKEIAKNKYKKIKKKEVIFIKIIQAYNV
jgi:hypothetical protein